MTNDPTRETGRWDLLHLLLKQIDAEIEALYVDRGIAGMRSRYVRPLIRIAHEGPLTISELAASLGSTHSAVTQTVASLKRSGYVLTEAGADSRTRVISLTPLGSELVPMLEAEWRATDAVVASLDDELGGAVSSLSGRLEQALKDRSMTQRLNDELGQQF